MFPFRSPSGSTPRAASRPGSDPSAGDLGARLSRLRARRRQRGVALVMVLGTLTLLTVMLTEFQDEASAELGSSVSARDSVRAEYAARSAVNLTRLLLASEPTIRNSAGMMLSLLTGGGKPPQIPIWKYSDLILGAFNDEEGREMFQGLSGLNLAEGENLGMEGAGFRIEVVDEDSKINVNIAARPDAFSKKKIAEQLLALMAGAQHEEFFQGLDERGNLADRQTICGAIIDWIDPDEAFEACDPRVEVRQQTAPEDSFYQMLPRPYRRKNAALDSLEELRMVRGVSDDFWTRFVEPDPDRPDKRKVTVWGSGSLNVNTANADTLLALVCSGTIPNTPICTTDVQQQLMFVQTVELMKGMMMGAPAFNSPKAFIDAVKGQGLIGQMLLAQGFQPIPLLSEKQLQDAVTLESKSFSIYATGYVRSGKHETRSRIHAVVDFRGAPPPGTALQYQALQAMGQGTPLPEGAEQLSMPATFEQGGIAGAFLPNPAGNILYYRVD